MRKKSLSVYHPKLTKEWHLTKNGDLTPKDVTAGSSQKVWWKCPKGNDHEWQARICDRKNGKGCPICRGLKVVKSNCLATTHPKLAKEWHPTKNGELTPNNVIAGSNKKIWWKCSKANDHEWQASPAERKRGNGCSICAGRKVVKSNCLATTHPKLAKEWHPTKNGDLTPYNVTSGRATNVWWKCLKADDHEWQARIYARKKAGCPICSGYKVAKSTCLATINPKLAEEWHPTKNEKLTPEDVNTTSHKKVWWKCPKGNDHEWTARIDHRNNGSGCLICKKLKVVKSNCLSSTHPKLANEWHPTKNAPLTPEDVVAGGHKKIWWKCPKGDDHEWKATLIGRKNGSGCPICRSLKVVKSNCLSSTHPKLAKEWHPTKNETLTPEEVVAGGHKKIWWKCPKGDDHEWKASISKRKHGQGCPICKGKKVVKSNCLSTTHPKLAKEWHPSKNDDLTPQDVIAGSDKKVWWKCLKDKKHEWKTTILSRYQGSGCPFCNLGWTINNIRHFVESIKDNIDALTSAELYILFQQSGLLSMYGKAKPFVEALKTGKFPKEELEKFCEGKPSLVDDIINNSSIILEDHLDMEEDLAHQEVTEKELEENIKEKKLPIIETKDILAALNNKVFSSADEEAIEFFIISGCAKIWKHVFQNEEEAINQLKQYKGSKYPTEVKNRFLKEYIGAKNLKIPSGDKFMINGKNIQANLMQRLVAYRVKSYKRQGNWSGTGAGKTLSAIIASRVINSKLTIVTCPNSVIEGWELNIEQAYPDSIIHTKTLKPQIDQTDNKNHYLILNYEAFQQPNSEAHVKQLTEKYKIDFIVIDEIHFSKQRVLENMSKRKKVIVGMISHGLENNSKLHVLGMSATPVINNLFEGISLLEMITGVKYDDLNYKPTVNNCMALYQKLSTIGIRWLPQYEQKLNLLKIPVDCTDYIDEISELNLKHTMLDLEKILTKARLPEIKKHIKPKTLIYTHYVEEIAKTLKDEIEKDGWKVAFFTGEDKSGKKSFIEGDTDVLIASSAIGTGVDGLQTVCSRLIINILPWTHAEFEQLKGRIYRQGQKASEVDIIVPLTKADINGKDWSWCESKWKRIQFKKSIADATVDGIVPEGHLRTPAQAFKDAMNWLKRLDRGEISKIERHKIHIPLSDTTIKKRISKYGDFSVMNNRMNRTNSQKTHERFQKDPKEWEQYHALYREAREEWLIVPYKEMINWCKARPDLVIGDFGCGEAKIAKALDNTVHSFDHIAIDDSVIACDISHVPLESGALDIAVFSLSLMGSNFTDYVKEAHRCLKLDGHLWIIETTSRFSDVKQFAKDLGKLGFDIVTTEEKYKFTFIRGIKNEKRIQDIKLVF